MNREEYRAPITEPDYPEFREDDYTDEDENPACGSGMKDGASNRGKLARDRSYGRESQADYQFYDNYEI
jgi:hypothetical protein